MPTLALLLSFALTPNVLLQAQQATFSTSTQLVTETVSVVDKSGNPVEGLTAKDFAVTENGVPQHIRFFEEQKLDATPQASPDRSAPEHVQLYSRLTPTRIMPELPGVNQYRDHRLLALYFDMTAMPIADQRRALEAALKFVRTQMTAADLIAIMRYGGGAVNVLQDFSGSRDRLLSVLQTMLTGEMLGAGQGFTESGDDASTPDAGFAFGQDDGEFNIFNTDRQLAALQTACGMLAPLHEKKSLIYFSSGLRLNGMNNQAQLHATVNAAVRAGVSFWPIDARGLVAEPPMGDATKGSPGGVDMYSGASAQATTTNLELSQDTLYSLATDTGGKALLDYNDLAKGLVDAQHATSSYYILGYYTTQAARDGRFRHVKVTLTIELSVKLSYRQGYYADKEFSRFTSDDRERQLEDALMLPDPITELTIAMEVDYFQMNRAEYFVPVIVKIPGRELALAKRGGAEHTLIDFVGEIKDRYGITRTNLRDKINIKLRDETAAQLAQRPIEYDTGFTLLPGQYTIKFLARDDETGRIGTYQTNFVIPNLNKVQEQIPISSVILSGQRVRMTEALYNVVAKKTAGENANPLVENGIKLVPSVTRVFSKSRPIWAYVQAYAQGSQAVSSLVAFLSLYNGSVKIFETPPVRANAASKNTVRTVPLKLEFNFGNLPSGKYDCQLTVLDPAQQKAAFWRTPIAIVP